MHIENARCRIPRAATIRTLGWLLLLGAGAGWAQQPETTPPQQPGQQTSQQPGQPAGQPANQPANQAGQPANPEAPAQPLAAPNGAQAQPSGPAAAGQAAGPPPDTRPLTGAQLITPTLPGSGRSYILPSFSVWEGADSNAELVPGTTQFEVATVPEGSLMLNHQGRNNQFGLSYGGGALIYDSHLGDNAVFEEFGIQDSYTGRRWTIFLTDRGAYLPQPITGFGGIGYAGGFGGFQSFGLSPGVSALNPTFGPEQSVLTGQYGVTSNSAVAQAQYSFTSRTSISAAGELGYEHFAQSGLLSGNNELMVLSIDHLLSPEDSVSLSYSFEAFRYNGGNAAVNNNLWRVGYGHRISERFTMSVTAGPQLTYSAIRQVPGVVRQLTWAGQALLGYRRSRGGFSVYYLHGLAPGSGIFEGAQTDSVAGSLDYDVTRAWTTSVSLGYARSTPLAGFSINPNFPNPRRVGYEFGSIRVNHPINRNLQWFAMYNVERQAAAQAFLPGTNGGLLLRHVFGIGLEIHPRPFGL